MSASVPAAAASEVPATVDIPAFAHMVLPEASPEVPGPPSPPPVPLYMRPLALFGTPTPSNKRSSDGPSVQDSRCVLVCVMCSTGMAGGGELWRTRQTDGGQEFEGRC